MVAAAGSGQQIGPLKMLTTRAGVHQSRMTELFEALLTAEERSSRMQLPLPTRDLAYVMVRINIVLQGESGGANLCLATSLAAKHDGNLAAIAGVYAMVPYISGAYGWNESDQLAELPSLVENNP